MTPNLRIYPRTEAVPCDRSVELMRPCPCLRPCGPVVTTRAAIPADGQALTTAPSPYSRERGESAPLPVDSPAPTPAVGLRKPSRGGVTAHAGAPPFARRHV